MQLAALDGLPAPPAVPQGSGDLVALGVATPATADSGAAGRLRCCPCRGRAAGSRDDRRRPWQAGCCRCRAAGLATAASLIAMKQNNSHSRFACVWFQSVPMDASRAVLWGTQEHEMLTVYKRDQHICAEF